MAVISLILCQSATADAASMLRMPEFASPREPQENSLPNDDALIPFNKHSGVRAAVLNALYNYSDIIQEGEVDDVPSFVVSIVSRGLNGGEYLCSGTLIAEDVVLTAGHCLINIKNIIVNVITRTKPFTLAPVPAKNWIAHPKNKVNKDGVLVDRLWGEGDYKFNVDIGLISLTQKVRIAPAIFVDKNFEPSTNKYKMYVFGLGRVNGSAISGRLGVLPLNSLYELGDSNIFAATVPYGSAICRGDSGGPVAAALPPSDKPSDRRYFLAGVTFTAYDSIDERAADAAVDERAGDCGGRSQYTFVTPFIDWIREAINTTLFPGEVRNLKVLAD